MGLDFSNLRRNRKHPAQHGAFLSHSAAHHSLSHSDAHRRGTRQRRDSHWRGPRQLLSRFSLFFSHTVTTGPPPSRVRPTRVFSLSRTVTWHTTPPVRHRRKSAATPNQEKEQNSKQAEPLTKRALPFTLLTSHFSLLTKRQSTPPYTGHRTPPLSSRRSPLFSGFTLLAHPTI